LHRWWGGKGKAAKDKEPVSTEVFPLPS
jgi:hypothetical protein